MVPGSNPGGPTTFTWPSMGASADQLLKTADPTPPIVMDEETGLLTPCGLDCGECEWHVGERQPSCPGCEAVEGRPFWGRCGTFTCAEEHGVMHCGVCGEFPCGQFVSQFDPNDPEGQRGAVYRVGLLAYRARHGDGKTLELMKKTQKRHG